MMASLKIKRPRLVVKHDDEKQRLITQAESRELALMTTLIAISSVALYGELFPFDCFKVRSIDLASVDCKYEDFATGKHEVTFDKEKSNRTKDFVTFRVLKDVSEGPQGHNLALLNDWINGLKTAMFDEHLSAMELIIHQKTKENNGTRQVVRVNFDYQNDLANAKTIRDAKASLVVLARSLNSTLQKGQSSDGQKMSMRLLYRKNRPRDFTVKGFKPAVNDAPIKTLEMDFQLVEGALDTGLHRASIALSGGGRHSSAMRVGECSSPSTITSMDEIQDASDNAKFSSITDTKNMTYHMIQTDKTREYDTQLLSPDNENKGSNYETSMECLLVYSSAVLKTAVDDRKNKEIPNNTNASKVKCSCAGQDIAEKMLMCHKCRTLQHMFCYGFLPSDKLTSAMHLCIGCIVGSVEEDSEVKNITNEFSELARIREVLYRLYKGGYPFDARLFQQIAETNKKTSLIQENQRVLKKLRAEGYLQASWQIGQKNFKNSGLRDYLVVATEESTLNLIRNYFTPTLKLEKYLSNPEKFVRKIRTINDAGAKVVKALSPRKIEFMKTGFGPGFPGSRCSQSFGNRGVDSASPADLKASHQGENAYRDNNHLTCYGNPHEPRGNRFKKLPPKGQEPLIYSGYGTKRFADDDINAGEGSSKGVKKRRLSASDITLLRNEGDPERIDITERTMIVGEHALEDVASDINQESSSNTGPPPYLGSSADFDEDLYGADD